MRRTNLLLPALVLLAPLGCGGSSSRPAADVQPPPPAPTVQVGSWDDLQQQVAAQTGKVVVLDMWATWWTACVREFPGLVQLHERYPDRVTCISFNMDYGGGEFPDTLAEDVERFLKSRRANFLTVVSSQPDAEIYEQLQLASIPAVLVYDQQGQLEKRFDNESGEYGQEGFSYEKQVAPLVAQLLEEDGGAL